MYRVTTPENVFTLPENASAYAVIQIAYKQRSEKLVKVCRDGGTAPGVSISGAVVTVTLTQEETKKFKAGEATVQVRVLTQSGRALASKRFPITFEEVNSEDILTP